VRTGARRTSIWSTTVAPARGDRRQLLRAVRGRRGDGEQPRSTRRPTIGPIGRAVDADSLGDAPLIEPGNSPPRLKGGELLHRDAERLRLLGE